MSQRRLLLSLVIAASILLSFFAGRWTGELKSSLQDEANYPWSLHKRIGEVNIQCETISKLTENNEFFVQVLSDKKVLVVATYEKQNGFVKAFAISRNGEVATDSWQLECK